MANLDAALTEIETHAEVGSNLVTRDILRSIFIAYHGEPDTKLDTVSTYKLEAGCQVRGRISGRIATVTYVGTKLVFLLVHDNGDETAWLKSELTVMAPAAPGVGDYVQIDRRDIRDTIFAVRTIKCSDGNVELWHIANRKWTRDEFTIICKARSK